MQSWILQALRAAPGEQPALHDEQRALSYAELHEAVGVESRWLQEHACGRCALLADNGAGWVIADLALMQLGSLNAPIPAWFTATQIEHVIEDAGIDCILTDEPDRILRDHTAFRHTGTSQHSKLTLFRREHRAAAQLPADIVKVTYTSGSTGAAKGVCLALDAIEQVARSIALTTPLGVTRHLCAMPLATLLENIAGIYAPLLLGATCIVPATRTTGMSYGALDPGAFLAAISRASPHSLILVPELLRLVIRAAQRDWRPPSDLKFIAVGGAAVAPGLLEEAAVLGLPAYEGYGLSECASVVCLNTPGEARRGSVGKPLPHARVRIDEQGQILVRGALMSGYLGQHANAADEIATGDLGSIDADGYVYIRGRVKNMFITSMGRNVSPEWVESELTRDAAIGQAIVVGEARPWPVALISPAGASVTSQQLERAIACANANLPSYARVRRWETLPQPLSFGDGLLTANGRPRRDVIAAHYVTLIDALYETALAS